MYEVSNQFKEYCKRHIRTFKNATITYYDGDEQQTIESEEIIKFDISAEPYIDYQIIGQAVAKKIHISIKGSYDLANKEINVTTTMIYDDNTEEVLNLGNYIIASDYDSSVKNQCSFTGYDYMIKMDNEYSDEGLNYPCTIRDVLENICEQKDIEFATEYLPNGDLEVIGNNFQDGATYRDVIKQIAQINGTFAYIDRSNKLHIDPLMNHDTITGNGTSITLQNTKAYGDINSIDLLGNTTQNGTPTPSSPVPVNNVTGEQVVRVCGKNLFDSNSVDIGHVYSSTGSYASSSLWNTSDWISVENNTQYALSWKTTDTANIFFSEFDANKTFIKRTTTSALTPTSNTKYIRMSYKNDLGTYNIQIEKGSATSYKPYQGKDYEINLGKNLANPSDFKFYTQTNASCSYDYDTNTLTMTTLREVTSNDLFLCTKIEDSLLKNGKSYTISSTNVSGVVHSLKLQLRNKNGTNASKPQGTTITYDNNYSLFIVSNPFASSGSTIVPQGSVAVIKNIQVEERKCSN